MTNRLPPNSTIGILGGGQLGRMLSIAASRLGLKTHIFEPGKNTPAGQVADAVTTASFDDHSALTKFAMSVDVITYEFENIPTEALDVIEAVRPVMPNRRSLAIAQDRLIEKKFLTSLGLQCAPYVNVETTEGLVNAITEIDTPSILKTRRFGYDGKGQTRLKADTSPTTAWEKLGRTPCILEGFIDFTHEVSVIGARSQSGEVVCFDPGENVHRGGILHTTTIPARLSRSQHMDAILATGKILNALDYVGVIGLELFVTTQGLIANEIAPRVHNSGHWTQNGCVIDQFEQHIRAIAGWQLGNGKRHSNVTMTNIIGLEVNDVETLSKDSSIGLHLYGKAEAKEGRKMGHVNLITGPA